MLDLTFNTKTKNKSFREFFFRKILDKAVKMIGPKFESVELSLNLIGRSEMARLNKKYRKKNKPTDVLSFPLKDMDETSDGVDKKLQKNAILSLGDIFICFPVAKKHAQGERIALKHKLAFLTIHGFLHLLGYDHEKSSKEDEKMAGLERKILKSIG